MDVKPLVVDVTAAVAVAAVAMSGQGTIEVTPLCVVR